MAGPKRKTGRAQWSKGPQLDEATFQVLRRRITEASGIFIPDDENSRFILEKRLLPRLRERGVTSFADYERAIDEAELEALLDSVAIHETYFFREKRQLRVFSEQVLPELARRGGVIKIWSAGCSTGEEAYTIAMLAAEQGLLQQGRVQIFASDLSRRVVEVGSQGIYGGSSFRTTEAAFKSRYFTPIDRAMWQVDRALQERVRFEQFNLMRLNNSHRAAPPGEDGYDVIFCRNVLMYFDDDAARETLKSFYSLLKEGGYLLLGHAESLLPVGTSFEAVQCGRELLHRK